jgi:hypothetical protein
LALALARDALNRKPTAEWFPNPLPLTSKLAWSLFVIHKNSWWEYVDAYQVYLTCFFGEFLMSGGRGSHLLARFRETGVAVRECWCCGAAPDQDCKNTETQVHLSWREFIPVPF